MEYVVVGEGTRRRVYLSHFGSDGCARFKTGSPGRTNALRFPDRPMAEAAAARAQSGDPCGYTWRPAAV